MIPSPPSIHDLNDLNNFETKRLMDEFGISDKGDIYQRLLTLSKLEATDLDKCNKEYEMIIRRIEERDLGNVEYIKQGLSTLEGKVLQGKRKREESNQIVQSNLHELKPEQLILRKLTGMKSTIENKTIPPKKLFELRKEFIIQLDTLKGLTQSEKSVEAVSNARYLIEYFNKECPHDDPLSLQDS